MSRSTYLGFFLIVGILSLSLAAYLLLDLVRGRQATVASARETARQQAITAASEIDAELRELQAVVRRLTRL